MLKCSTCFFQNKAALLFAVEKQNSTDKMAEEEI